VKVDRSGTGSGGRETVRWRGRQWRDHLAQRAFEHSGAGEQLAIEPIEIILGQEKHEAAGHSYGDADRATVELDQESLMLH
jgi:hypothetical protein